jgi:predicted transcriptional regulator
VQVKVSLTPELHERLREVASQLGQAPATVASMAIGQYVANLSRQLGATERAIEAMTERLGPEVAEEFRTQMKLAAGGRNVD